MYGKSPAFDYLGIEDKAFGYKVDLTCSVAHWEDENHQYEEAEKKNKSQSAAIGNVLENYRKQMKERG